MRAIDKHLLILAGGKATRLSALMGQSSKALVTVGQQPMIVRQILGIGIENVTVVVSPSTRHELETVVSQSIGQLYNVRYATQSWPHGPSNALALGLESILSCTPRDRRAAVTVIMADTLVDFTRVPSPTSHWVGVARTHERRNWCMHLDDQWVDCDDPPLPVDVSIGLFAVPDANVALKAPAWTAPEVMDFALNVFARTWTQALVDFTESWHDTGDVKALARARRSTFISRSHHGVTLDYAGYITKRNVDQDERDYLLSLPPRQAHLFPRVRSFDANEITMEYINWPTLAELWLYRQGTPEMWKHVLNTVLRSARVLWDSDERQPNDIDVQTSADLMYRRKTIERINASGVNISKKHLLLLLEMIQDELVPETNIRARFIHGDLNFGNIFYALGDDLVRFVDPRGKWGGPTHGWGDVLYEFAKLRYSYRDHFSAICHGLFKKTADGYVFPEADYRLVEAMDHTLMQFLPVIIPDPMRLVTIIEAALFLSAMTLHPPAQRFALMQQGIKLIEELT